MHSHTPESVLLDTLFPAVHKAAQETGTLGENVEATLKDLEYYKLRLLEPDLKIVIVGLVKGGKSTFNNTILEGIPALPTNILPETVGVVYIQDLDPSDTKNRPWSMGQTYPPQPADEPPMLLFTKDNASRCKRTEPWPNQRRLALACGCKDIRAFLHSANRQAREGGSNQGIPSELVLRSPLPWVRGIPVPITFVDSPGANESHLTCVQPIVRKLLSEADMLLYVLDVTQLGSTDEHHLLMDVANCAPPILRNLQSRGFFLLNKMDRTPASADDLDNPNVKKYREQTQKFLRQITVDGKPFEVPLDRIIPISAEHGYLAKALIRSRSLLNCPEDEQDRLVKMFFGVRMTPRKVLGDPNLHQELLDGISDVFLRSNCGLVDDIIKKFLTDQAHPLMIQSLSSRLQEILAPLEVVLNRRKLTANLSVEALTARIRAIQKMLSDMYEQHAIEKVLELVGTYEQQAIDKVHKWRNDLKEPVTRYNNSHEYPTEAAAQAAAKEVTQQSYTTWLADVITKKTGLESEISQTHVKAASEIEKLIQQIVDRIMAVLEDGSTFDLSHLRKALSTIILPKTGMTHAISFDVKGLGNLIKQNCRQVSWVEQESYLADEQYEDIVYDTIRHTKKSCRGTTTWTENRPRKVTKTRKVQKFRPVTRHRTDVKWTISSDLVLNFVQQHCRSHADTIFRSLSDAVHQSFTELKDKVQADGITQIQQFLQQLDADVKRNRREAQVREAETIKVEGLLNELLNFKFLLNDIAGSVCLKPVEIHVPKKRIGTSTDAASKKAYAFLSKCRKLPRSLPDGPASGSWSDIILIHCKILQHVLDHDLNPTREIIDQLVSAITELKSSLVTICVAGLMKAGKSTLVNALNAFYALPESVLPETAEILHIEDYRFRDPHLSPDQLPMLLEVSPAAARITTDYFSSKDGVRKIASGIEECRLYLEQLNDQVRSRSDRLNAANSSFVLLNELPWLGAMRSAPVQVLDTPGFNELMLEDRVRRNVGEALNASEVVVYVMACTKMFQEDESNLIAHLHNWMDRVIKKRIQETRYACQRNSPLPMVFVVNKFDEWKLRNPGVSPVEFSEKVLTWIHKQLALVCPPGMDVRTLIPPENVICASGKHAHLASLIRTGKISMKFAEQAIDCFYGKSGTSDPDPQEVERFLEASSCISQVKQKIFDSLRQTSLLPRAIAAVQKTLYFLEYLPVSQHPLLAECQQDLFFLLQSNLF